MAITVNKYPNGSTELVAIVGILGNMGGGMSKGIIFPDPLLKGVPNTAFDRVKKAVKRTYGEPFIIASDFSQAGYYPSGNADWLDGFDRDKAAKYIVHINGLFIYNMEPYVLKKPQGVIDKTAQYNELVNKFNRTDTEEKTLQDLDHFLESYYSQCI